MQLLRNSSAAIGALSTTAAKPNNALATSSVGLAVNLV